VPWEAVSCETPKSLPDPADPRVPGVARPVGTTAPDQQYSRGLHAPVVQFATSQDVPVPSKPPQPRTKVVLHTLSGGSLYPEVN